MTKLPKNDVTSCVSALLKLGFQIKRQHGSHIILRCDVHSRRWSCQITRSSTLVLRVQSCAKPEYCRASLALCSRSLVHRIVAACCATFSKTSGGKTA